MTRSSHIAEAFRAALPIILGYAAIGIPCGILCASIGMNALQVLIMCVLFYSGAGQFMIPNMWLSASPIASIVLSVSMVNTRQMLYSASLSRYCQNISRGLAFLFAATVTDESFGVNTGKWEAGEWDVKRATAVNLFSQSSWTVFNVLGVFVGNAISVPLAIASFAMTAIFICLAATQKMTPENICAIVCAFVGVYVAKVCGLGGFSIVAGAILGVVAALVLSGIRRKRAGETVSDAIEESPEDVTAAEEPSYSPVAGKDAGCVPEDGEGR